MPQQPDLHIEIFQFGGRDRGESRVVLRCPIGRSIDCLQQRHRLAEHAAARPQLAASLETDERAIERHLGDLGQGIVHRVGKALPLYGRDDPTPGRTTDRRLLPIGQLGPARGAVSLIVLLCHWRLLPGSLVRRLGSGELADPNRLPPSAPITRLGIETPGDRLAAMTAAVPDQVVDAQRISVAFDHDPAAAGAIGALTLPVTDVARISVPQTGGSSNIMGRFERLGWRGVAIGQLEIGMERREVDRYVGSQFLDHPIAHPLYLVRRVVRIGNQQIGNLKPNVRFPGQPSQRVHDRLQMAAAKLRIERFGEGLQIDVGRVDIAIEGGPALGRDVSRGNGHGLHARLATCPGRINCIFGPNDRVVVGKGDTAATELLGSPGDRFRIGRLTASIDILRPRRGPVLAELASEIAAGRAEREDGRARVELVQRLLLDRVDGEPGAPAIGRRDDLAVAVLANEAEPPLPRCDDTLPRADITRSQSGPSLEFVPPSADFGPIRQPRQVRRQCDDFRHGDCAPYSDGECDGWLRTSGDIAHS